MIILTPEDTIGFKSLSFNVGQNNSEGSKVDQC
jgi:hypothetical protein